MIGKAIGQYKLNGEIGFGGMGAVYQATDTETGQLVAVKLLSQEYINDLGLRSAFESEAQLVNSLTHEAIVPVYEFGQEGEQPYLVMQYMPNGSLADRLLQGVLTPEELMPLLDRLCGAIDYAHQRGIIHRDLKPSNILFDEDDLAYLADFGIARQPTSRQAFSPVNGTPAYLSPEQALGDEGVDGRSDIYSLGIILFEALTGELPFDGQIPLTIILKQVHDQAPSLRSVDWNLPPALDEVVQRALAKDPADRFSTAGELASAYRLALSSESASPQPASHPDQKEDQSRDGSSGGPEVAAQDSADKLKGPARLPAGKRDGTGHPNPNRINFLRPRQVSASDKWRWTHLITLGLATYMGLILAAGLTAFLHLPQHEDLSASRFVGIQLTFDRTSLVLINLTPEPLDLSGLSFRRIADRDAPPAEFRASLWRDAVSTGQSALPPGMCYLLLLPEAASFSLMPGKPLPSIPDCTSLQGWLSIPDPQSWFWVSEEDSDSFVVIWNGSAIHTCSIEAGSCRINFEAP